MTKGSMFVLILVMSILGVLVVAVLPKVVFDMLDKAITVPTERAEPGKVYDFGKCGTPCKGARSAVER